MATYAPDQVGIKAPSGGFQQGGWYGGRQYWNGTLSDPGVIHPESNQQGAGQAVSQEVNAQSAAAQGVTAPQLESYLQQQRQQPVQPAPTKAPAPSRALPATTTAASGAGMGTSASGSTGNGTVTGFNQPTIDLPSFYKSLYQNSGITDKETQLTQREQQYLEAKSKISDNPFLAASTMDKRLQRLQAKYDTETKPLRDEIATKKADIETQLNIQTKQFDINSQQAQLALQQFNSLLQLGAFNNASGDDIAAITRATGLSSSMIQGAVDANKAKDVKTSVIQYDDGTNQGFAVINANTGDVISRQVIAGSKPKEATATQTKEYEQSVNTQHATQDARNGVTLQELVATYGVPGGLSIDEIYRLYNSNSPRGAAKETLDQVKKGLYATQKGFVSAQ